MSGLEILGEGQRKQKPIVADLNLKLMVFIIAYCPSVPTDMLLDVFANTDFPITGYLEFSFMKVVFLVALFDFLLLEFDVDPWEGSHFGVVEEIIYRMLD